MGLPALEPKRVAVAGKVATFEHIAARHVCTGWKQVPLSDDRSVTWGAGFTSCLPGLRAAAFLETGEEPDSPGHLLRPPIFGNYCGNFMFP
jgi:hypothetical protein